MLKISSRPLPLVTEHTTVAGVELTMFGIKSLGKSAINTRHQVNLAKVVWNLGLERTKVELAIHDLKRGAEIEKIVAQVAARVDKVQEEYLQAVQLYKPELLVREINKNIPASSPSVSHIPSHKAPVTTAN